MKQIRWQWSEYSDARRDSASNSLCLNGDGWSILVWRDPAGWHSGRPHDLRRLPVKKVIAHINTLRAEALAKQFAGVDT